MTRKEPFTQIQPGESVWFQNVRGTTLQILRRRTIPAGQLATMVQLPFLEIRLAKIDMVRFHLEKMSDQLDEASEADQVIGGKICAAGAIDEIIGQLAIIDREQIEQLMVSGYANRRLLALLYEAAAIAAECTAGDPKK